MKRIFTLTGIKRKWLLGASVTCEDSLGLQSRFGYHIREKDLRRIHRVACSGDVVKMQQLFFMGKVTVDSRDKMNRTSLHLACASGHPQVVNLLVERNCMIDPTDKRNATPLIKATQCHEVECGSILLMHGADPNHMDDGGNTALHYAAYSENLDMAKQLLKYGADIEAKNKDGYTPLLVAMQEQREKMIEFLIMNKANVHAVDNMNRTTLMFAAQYRSPTILATLLQKGVDVFCKDKYGFTAEKYARLKINTKNRMMILDYMEKIKEKLLQKKLLGEECSKDDMTRICNRTVGDEMEDIHFSSKRYSLANMASDIDASMPQGYDEVTYVQEFQQEDKFDIIEEENIETTLNYETTPVISLKENIDESMDAYETVNVMKEAEGTYEETKSIQGFAMNLLSDDVQSMTPELEHISSLPHYDTVTAFKEEQENLDSSENYQPQVLGSHLQSQTEEIPFVSDASLENLTNYCYVLDDEMQKMSKKSKETEIQYQIGHKKVVAQNSQTLDERLQRLQAANHVLKITIEKQAHSVKQLRKELLIPSSEDVLDSASKSSEIHIIERAPENPPLMYELTPINRFDDDVSGSEDEGVETADTSEQFAKSELEDKRQDSIKIEEGDRDKFSFLKFRMSEYAADAAQDQSITAKATQPPRQDSYKKTDPTQDMSKKFYDSYQALNQQSTESGLRRSRCYPSFCVKGTTSSKSIEQLQAQASSQTLLRSQKNYSNEELNAELSKMKKLHEDLDRKILDKCKQIYLAEEEIGKAWSSELNNTYETLAVGKTEHFLEEQQKSYLPTTFPMKLSQSSNIGDSSYSPLRNAPVRAQESMMSPYPRRQSSYRSTLSPPNMQLLEMEPDHPGSSEDT
ncbi:putative ankyrin repeat domain-containing protein 20A2 isoform X2 [Ochotona princeps]|uniref:putative ankyrin repeat domain-containing protein 20A2 isoform X2 n=1 Tax=Ochotona princeps TaxID=9978 RepID=UPI0027144AF4|nr:putative ankyrin repeat domain-containing protein 20A2 isoform X2 [Ochotona princeps]